MLPVDVLQLGHLLVGKSKEKFGAACGLRGEVFQLVPIRNVVGDTVAEILL